MNDLYKRSFLILLLTAVSLHNVFSQKDSLSVRFNQAVLNAGDTLNLYAELFSIKPSLKVATLNCIVRNDKGFEQKLRWPLVNKSAYVQLVIDSQLTKGVYKFVFSVAADFFKIRGHVTGKEILKDLRVVLIDNKGSMNIDVVNVDAENNFVFKNYLFENAATVIFSRNSKKQNKPLNIFIETPVDSVFTPVTVTAKQILISKNVPAGFQQDALLLEDDTSGFNKAKYLSEVIVVSKKAKTTEIYDEKYTNGIFQGGDGHIYDVINDPMAASSDVLEYLQSKMANLFIKYNNNGETSVVMRNTPVQFYVDQAALDVDVVRSITMADIAIIKVLPPPFIGNTGGNGAAIAIYTRKGNDIVTNRSSDKHIFRVLGYSPAVSHLSK
jgi:hypothetical protein